MAPFWLPKSSKILPKIDPKMYQIFDRFFTKIFYRFLLVFGSQLGAMLATFSLKKGVAVKGPPLFCWVYVIFRFWNRPGPILAPFGLDFGRFGLRFWKFLTSILEVSGHDLDPMRLVIMVLFKLFFFKASIGTLRCWAGGVTRSAKN